MYFSHKILIIGLIAMFFISCAKEQLITEPGKLVPMTVDEDPALPAITVNGAMLHAEAYGHPDSTLVVVIHGGPGGDYRSLLNCTDLANEGFRVIFYDQRGSGLSQRFPYSSYVDKGLGALDLMYDDLSGVIAHYRKSPDQKVFLLGHSWGGMLATAYAGKYPEAVQGLVVCEPGGLKYNDILDYIAASRDFKLLEETMNDGIYPDQFITGKENQHEILDYKQGILASENEITGDVNPTRFWRSGALINLALLKIGEEYEPDFSQGIEQYETPVLFIYSEKNRAYPDAWALKVSAAYNSVSLAKIAGTGHEGIIADDDAWTNKTMPQVVSYFKSIQ